MGALPETAARTAAGKGVTMHIVREHKERDGFFWVEQLLVHGRSIQETAQDLDTLSGISGAWEVRFEVLSAIYRVGRGRRGGRDRCADHAFSFCAAW